MDGIGSVGGTEGVVPMGDVTRITPGEVFQPPGPDSLPKEKGLEVKVEQRPAVRAAHNSIMHNHLHVDVVNSKIANVANTVMLLGLAGMINDYKK